MQDVIKKFKFRDNGVVFNAPTAIEKEFKKIGFKTNFDKKMISVFEEKVAGEDTGNVETFSSLKVIRLSAIIILFY